MSRQGRQRMCIGCRRVAPPGELVRIARRPDSSIGVGAAQPGRGAWLCAAGSPEAFGFQAGQLAHSEKAQPACFESAVRRKAFERALRCEVDAYVIDRLRGELVVGGPGSVSLATTGTRGGAPT